MLFRSRKYQKGSEVQRKQETGTSGERELLACIVQFSNLARNFMEETGPKPFSTPIMKTIADEIFHRIAEGLDISSSELMGSLPERQTQELVASVSMITIEEKTAEKCVKDNIKRFKINELRAQRSQISRIIIQETDMKKKSALIEKSNDLFAKLKMFENSQK